MAKKKKKTPSNKPASAKREVLVKEPAPADNEGRLPAQELKRFGVLVEVLTNIAAREENAEAKWNTDMFQRGAIPGENFKDMFSMTGYILQNIERISQEIDSGRHDQIIRKFIGRRLSLEEKKEIRSWKSHFFDQFIVVDHIPNKGSVFVSLGGNVTQRSPESVRANARLFLVRGLTVPTSQMIPHDNVCCVLTTIIPFCGGLTYMAHMAEPKKSLGGQMIVDDMIPLAIDVYEASKRNMPGAPRMYSSLTEEQFSRFRRESSVSADVETEKLIFSTGGTRYVVEESTTAKPEGSPKHCAYCGTKEEDKLSQCPCMKVHYCSVEHQRSDWKTHKKDCSARKRKS